jgi:hypothetical protein
MVDACGSGDSIRRRSLARSATGCRRDGRAFSRRAGPDRRRRGVEAREANIETPRGRELRGRFRVVHHFPSGMARLQVSWFAGEVDIAPHRQCEIWHDEPGEFSACADGPSNGSSTGSSVQVSATGGSSAVPIP